MSKTTTTEPLRTWHLLEDGYEYDTCEAATAEDALEIAKANVDRGNYSDAEGTLWIDVTVRADETDDYYEEEASATVQLDEEEPSCSADAHDWQAPYEIVGGIQENPGVWGHGGGVIIKKCCMHCGCARVTDTWAQRPDNGVQGYESVSYEPGLYADDLEAMRVEAEDDAI